MSASDSAPTPGTASPTRAMILAAGRGERLRPLTDHTPKPMVEVRGRPLLAHQIDWLNRAGIRNLVINLHHLGEQIEAHFADGSAFDTHIQYSREETLLETGGGIVKALPLLGDQPFLILNGDIFTDFPFSTLKPIPDWADIHLVVTPTPAYREQGDFEYNDGRITARGEAYVYCGIAILRPEQFAGERVAPFSLRDRFFRAIESGTLSAQVWSGAWIDIGSQAQLDAVNAAEFG